MDVQNCFTVIFHNVKEYYSPGSKINCQFLIKENANLNEPENCYIGIFIVAWDTVDNAIIKKSFQSLELAGTSNSMYDLNFDLGEIPLTLIEDDEFYQFCFYNIQSEDVFGASCPFQICHLKEDNMVHIERMNESTLDSIVSVNSDDGESSWWFKEGDRPVFVDLEDKDTVLIHSKTTLLENALTKATKEKEDAIIATQQKFEVELKQFTVENKVIIEKSEAEIIHLKTLNQSLTERESLFKQNLIDSQNVVKQMEKFAEENSRKNDILLQNLTQEKDVLVQALSDMESKNLEYIERLKTGLYAKIQSSEDRCDALNNSLIAEKHKLEKMQFDNEDIILNLRKEIKLMGIKENQSIHETSKTLSELQGNLNTEISQKYEYLNEIDKLTQSVTKMSEENYLKDIVIKGEREKLAQLSLQQQEMTSRLGEENVKICLEIKNLKLHETSLVEAHQKELAYHRNRIDEIELKANEAILEFKTEIEKLNNELNDKINCINMLEAKIRESNENVQHIEALKDENMKLSDTVDELTAMLESTGHTSHHSSFDSKKNESKEYGSMHALHIANAHMQKQLKSLKKEREMHCCQTSNSVSASDSILRENEEFKLRLCMGKKAFDKQFMECQKLRNELNRLKMSSSTYSCSSEADTKKDDDEYNSLLLEFNNFKSNNSLRLQELVSEVEKVKEEKEEAHINLAKSNSEKDSCLQMNGDLKVKLRQLVNNYEDKINLLTEENNNLRVQRTALMAGAGCINSEVKQSSPDIVQTSVTCATPNVVQMNRDVLRKERNNQDAPPSVRKRTSDVVNRQPDNLKPASHHTVVSSSSDKVIHKQPTLLPNLLYPPSMMPKSQQQKPIYPTEPQQICRSPMSRDSGSSPPGIADPFKLSDPFSLSDPFVNAEPPSQVIPNRNTADQLFQCARGSAELLSFPIQIDNDPTQKCPICELDFPANLTEKAKTDHVNSHFDQ